MAIKNYTTKIDCYQSIGEIQGVLAKNGARKIMIDYDNTGLPVGIAFAIQTQQQMQAFILPANIDGVMSVFKKQNLKADIEQAKRTAWRNVRDWIMAQMAFIESGNVQMDEIFLPYLSDGKKTLYQAYKSGQLLLGDGGL
nr:MAG TPA: hypothetical protein [Caudoviricetes sp.]